MNRLTFLLKFGRTPLFVLVVLLVAIAAIPVAAGSNNTEFAEAGYYPTRYCTFYQNGQDIYRITLDKFEWFDSE